jgi:tyrosine-specific transport protein
VKTVTKFCTPVAAKLFSNLEFDGKEFRHQPGSILGSTALVAGTTVGAGILAMPTFTLPSGIVPSTVLLIGVWLYALISALLITKVTLNTMSQTGRVSVSLLTMVEKTLGKVVARIASGAYLFLHYALLVAYISQGGEILTSLSNKIWNIQQILPGLGGSVFTIIFGGMMYLVREKLIEKINNIFVGIVISSFVGLLLVVGNQINFEQFYFQNWSALPPAISVMLVALFYHNIVPVITVQLEGDYQKIRQSIIIGSLIPLAMFLIWNAVILGSVSPEILKSVSQGNAVFDPLQILRNGSAGEWIGLLVSVFSEFAIVTSFIGFVYGLLDFFQDFPLFRDSKYSNNRLPLLGFVLFPPMSLSALNPSIFFTALDYAGTFSISVLGGIIPALMVWKQRYQNLDLHSINKPYFSGGKVTMVVMICIALVVILQQIISY